MEPLAMIHMAMPVTKRGWMNFAMLPTFFRNFMPTMFVSRSQHGRAFRSCRGGSIRLRGEPSHCWATAG
jgi:hypothetical protein